MAFAVRLTLPLSGRQGAFGGQAGCLWWLVHSKGLFEGFSDASSGSMPSFRLLPQRRRVADHDEGCPTIGMQVWIAAD
jgi:hypothetical protein